METVRPPQRFRMDPLTEWLLAALLLIAVLRIGALVGRELRASPMPVAAASLARTLTPSVPRAVPPRAVSVPMLPFRDGKQVRVGQTIAAVATTLGRSAEVGSQDVDRGALGERLTRFCDYRGARFILVFEPTDPSGEPHLAALYLP